MTEDTLAAEFKIYKEEYEEKIATLRFDIEPYYTKLKGMATPAELRKFFGDEGIQGQQRDGNRCLIAAYIRERTGHTVAVSGSGQVFDEEMSVGLFGSSNALTKFVYYFDNGKYPELVKDFDKYGYVDESVVGS
jgi:hypothetical protein